MVQFVRNRFLGGPWYLDILTLAMGALIILVMFTVIFDELPRPEGVPWTAMLPGAALMTAGLLIIRLVTIVYFSPTARIGERPLRRVGDGRDLPALALCDQPDPHRGHLPKRDDLAARRTA